MNKQHKYGVWMDTHKATVVGATAPEFEKWEILAHVEAERSTAKGERNENNQEQNIMAKFLKEISSHLTNANQVHITGTGTAQEQLINHLSETPEFKNAKTNESTSNEMSEEKLLEYFSDKF